jgi:hypothetical protein
MCLCAHGTFLMIFEKINSMLHESNVHFVCILQQESFNYMMNSSNASLRRASPLHLGERRGGGGGGGPA